MTDETMKNIELLPDEEDFISDLKAIVYSAKPNSKKGFFRYNLTCIWLLGRRIVEQEHFGRTRAEYEEFVMEIASLALSEEFGKHYGIGQLRLFREFYLTFQNMQFGLTPTDEYDGIEDSKDNISSDESQILRVIPDNLSWSHYLRLMKIEDEKERNWYMREASLGRWNFATLNKNIDSGYYNQLQKTLELQK